MSDQIDESIQTARKKVQVAQSEVRDEVEAEKAKKEKERLARIKEVEKRQEERLKATQQEKGMLGNFRKRIREAMGQTHENNG